MTTVDPPTDRTAIVLTLAVELMREKVSSLLTLALNC